MEGSNGFTTSDAVLTAAMSGGLNGGNRGGMGDWGGGMGYGLQAGNSVLAAESHANGTALKASIDCHSEQFGAGLDRISAQNAETRNLFKLDEILKGTADAEFRSLDRQRDIERLVVDNAKEAARCCCDAQLLAQKNACELKALVISENSATRELIRGDALIAANAKIAFLETVAALSGKK